MQEEDTLILLPALVSRLTHFSIKCVVVLKLHKFPADVTAKIESELGSTSQSMKVEFLWDSSIEAGRPFSSGMLASPLTLCLAGRFAARTLSSPCVKKKYEEREREREREVG